MRKNITFSSYVMSFGALCIALSALAAPIDVFAKKKPIKKKYYTPSAIRGADERNFKIATTRCLTKAMKSLNASAVLRMNRDIADAEKKMGKSFVSAPIEAEAPLFENRSQASVCSSAPNLTSPFICVLDRSIAGMKYRIGFGGLEKSELIAIAPKTDILHSAPISVQADSTHGNASGTIGFDGLSSGEYTAYIVNAPQVNVQFSVVSVSSSTQNNFDVSAVSHSKKNPAEIYREKMETVWAAMAQPYCGYGSRGVAAVKKSYNKSVEHIRADFLNGVRHQTVDKIY